MPRLSAHQRWLLQAALGSANVKAAEATRKAEQVKTPVALNNESPEANNASREKITPSVQQR